MTHFATLLQEHRTAVVGPNILSEIAKTSHKTLHELLQKANGPSQWINTIDSRDVMDDLTAQYLVKEHQIYYMFDVANTLQQWRQLLTRQIHITLSRHRMLQITEHLLTRAHRFLNSKKVVSKLSVADGTIYALRDSVEPYQPLFQEPLRRIVNYLRIIPRLPPFDEPVPKVYSQRDFVLLITLILEARRGGVTSEELHTILALLLIDWIPPLDPSDPNTNSDNGSNAHECFQQMACDMARGLSVVEVAILLGRLTGLSDLEISHDFAISLPVLTRQRSVLFDFLRRTLSNLDNNLQAHFIRQIGLSMAREHRDVLVRAIIQATSNNRNFPLSTYGSAHQYLTFWLNASEMSDITRQERTIAVLDTLVPQTYSWRQPLPSGEFTDNDIIEGDIVAVGAINEDDSARCLVAVLAVDPQRRCFLGALINNEVALATSDDLILAPNDTELPYNVVLMPRIARYLWYVQVDTRVGVLTKEALHAAIASYEGSWNEFQNMRSGIALQGPEHDLRWQTLENQADALYTLAEDCANRRLNRHVGKAIVSPGLVDLLLQPPDANFPAELFSSLALAIRTGKNQGFSPGCLARMADGVHHQFLRAYTPLFAIRAPITSFDNLDSLSHVGEWAMRLTIAEGLEEAPFVRIAGHPERLASVRFHYNGKRAELMAADS